MLADEKEETEADLTITRWPNLDEGLGCLCICTGIAIIILAVGYCTVL